jgi:AhpD family alkylhydroperoxidase
MAMRQRDGSGAIESGEDFFRSRHNGSTGLVLIANSIPQDCDMTPRLNPMTTAPKLMQAMLELEGKVSGSGLEKSLMGLVKVRASQINGCAFCINMHAKEAREHGESEERLYLLNAWREAPCYSERERAALAWTEALTLLSETHAPDADYEAMKAQFTEEEQVKLTLLIATINSWNRIVVGFRTVPAVGEHRHGQN